MTAGPRSEIETEDCLDRNAVKVQECGHLATTIAGKFMKTTSVAILRWISFTDR